MRHEHPAPFNFLGLPPRPWEECRVGVLPVPYDASVSYGTGARWGPTHLLQASRFVELYDEELGAETSDLGFFTLDEVEPVIDPEKMSRRVEKAVDGILKDGKFPVTIGGDHSQTLGALRAVHRKHPRLSVVHIDAHDDLRDEWNGSRYSHACVMRRAYDEGIKGIHLGIRAQDKETVAFARKAGARIFHARKRGEWKLEEMLAGLPNRDVYVSIDVDALDPSIMPSTGTPEPGGLLWDELCGWLRGLARERRVVGFDVMELAPIPGLHAPDFLAAKLVYKLAGYSLEKELER
jgi:agmatinase